MQILWLLVFCSWLITIAPLQGASDKPKRGGTLTLGISREPALIHPMIATGSVERKVRELMFESLLGVDINGRIQPSESDLKRRRNNLSGHCDKEVEALLDQAEQELDIAKRRALFKQILQKHFEDVAEIYLGYAPRFYSLRDYVKGFNTSGDDVYRWWGGGVNHTWLDK